MSTPMTTNATVENTKVWLLLADASNALFDALPSATGASKRGHSGLRRGPDNTVLGGLACDGLGAAPLGCWAASVHVFPPSRE